MTVEPTPKLDRLQRIEAEMILERISFDDQALEDFVYMAIYLKSRLAEVEKAGREFLERYDLLEPDLSGVFTFYAVHGMKWPEDRNWKSELEALREAIKRSSA